MESSTFYKYFLSLIVDLVSLIFAASVIYLVTSINLEIYASSSSAVASLSGISTSVVTSEGKIGRSPVMIANGGNPWDAAVVYLNANNAVGISSDQKCGEPSKLHLLMISLIVLIVLSTWPFALLFPTVICLCETPRWVSNLLKSAAHSAPLSVLTHAGFPHLQTTSLQNHEATLKACLLLMGAASTHFDMQSTATIRYLFPSSSAGKGPAKSIDHPVAGVMGRSVARYGS